MKQNETLEHNPNTLLNNNKSTQYKKKKTEFNSLHLPPPPRPPHPLPYLGHRQRDSPQDTVCSLGIDTSAIGSYQMRTLCEGDFSVCVKPELQLAAYWGVDYEGIGDCFVAGVASEAVELVA